MRTSQGGPSIQRFIFMPNLRPDVLFLRTPLASFRDNDAQGPSPRLPTLQRTWGHPLTSLRPIPIANPIHHLATATPIVVRRSRAVNTRGISPAADEMTVGRHLLRPVTVGNRYAAGPHLALSETTTDATTSEAVPAVYRHESPPCRGRHLVSVLRLAESAHGTRTRFRDYDRRRDDSRDRYEDRRH